MVTYLNENQWNVHWHRVGDIYFALTSRYSIGIYILTTRFCLVLLIVNDSQINGLSCQIFGISKQAQDFERDGKILHPRWKKFWREKCHFLTTPPLENGLVQEILHLGNLRRTKFLVTFDGFHGSESISVDFMIKYILCLQRTDEMLTLNWSHSYGSSCLISFTTQFIAFAMLVSSHHCISVIINILRDTVILLSWGKLTQTSPRVFD